MTFKSRPSTYAINRAPTGRGRCRKCKHIIPKGELRIVITAFLRPGRSTHLLRCASCACLPAFAAAVRAVYGAPPRACLARRRRSCVRRCRAQWMPPHRTRSRLGRQRWPHRTRCQS